MRKLLSAIAIILLLISCNNTNYSEKENPKKGLRIISLASSISRELVNLGLEKNIVGATSYCDITKSNKNLIIGTSIEINLEKILLLKPDIIFASSLTKQSSIAALKKQGIKVHKLGKVESYDMICAHFIEMGELVGKSKLAKSIVANSNKKVDSLKRIASKGDSKRKIYFQIGSNPIFSVIPNTFMNDYIEFANCENIANDLTSGTMTRESVLQRNPDIMFIVTMGIVGDNEQEIWRNYTDLTAIKSNNIFILDANIACTPTVLSFTETLEQVINNCSNAKYCDRK